MSIRTVGEFRVLNAFKDVAVVIGVNTGSTTLGDDCEFTFVVCGGGVFGSLELHLAGKILHFWVFGIVEIGLLGVSRCHRRVV